jgi:hypothetical protein
MPAVKIIDSAIVELLDFKARFNLVSGSLTVDMSATDWKAGGAAQAQGARLTIVSPSGVIMANGSGFAFQPPMTGSVVLTLPKIGGIYEWGVYQFRLQLVESDGATYTLNKSFNLCAPYEIGRNEGAMNFRFDVDCDNTTMILYGGDSFTYKGKEATFYDRHFTFFYPADAQAENVTIVNMPAKLTLYSGLNKVKGHSDGTFELSDNFSVVVRYAGEAEKYVQCGFPCYLWCAFKALMEDVALTDCDSGEYPRKFERLQQAQIYMNAVLFGSRCGQNTDEYIEILNEILNAKEFPCN